MDLEHRLCAALAGIPADGPWLVAVSGGPDSMALLDLVVRAGFARSPGVVVAHVDHGIHPESGEVAAMVRAAAERYGVRCEVERLALGPGASETLARERRYASLHALRRRLGARWVLTAHHADDQVETVLLRVLAGSGPAGLAGMAPTAGHVARPLLGVTRAELLRYAAERGLAFWEDPANRDARHRRNWVRHEVLPALRTRVPGIDRNLHALAREAASQRAAFDQLLDLLPGLDLRGESRGISVAAAGLGGYASELAGAVLQAVARRVNCPLGPVRARRVLTWLAGTGPAGGSLDLARGWRAELSLGRLTLAVRRPAGVAPMALHGAQGEATWLDWRLAWRTEPAPQVQRRASTTAWFPTNAALVVRSRAAAERIRPLGMSGHKLVSRCLQEARILRGGRDEWPVVTVGGTAVWLPGVCRSADLVPEPGTEAVRIDVTRDD
ncbi:MAG: tRNA lysidine(34) synthetase TilS [Gemmatimonadota bacterium]